MEQDNSRALELIAKEKKEKTGTLNLHGFQLIKVPDEIIELTWLNELYLRSNQINDYSFLSGLTSLHTLDLNSNQISDISFLSGLTSLQSLALNNNQIRDISFLSGLTSLETLNLSGHQIKNISILQKLSNLRTLKIYNTDVSDFGYLSHLSKLEDVFLMNNQISDISFLQKLNKLKNINIGLNQISDISFLSGLTSLHTLGLSSNQISDISFLSGLTSLQSLDLRFNQISDISFLSGLTSLQSLDLSSNQISDYSFLSGLTSLQTLYLSSNQISDYSFLSGLTSLQTLDLSSNQISDYSFLSGLTSLQTLYLSSNQISDYSFLSGLTSLQTLDLRSNQISDISFLSGLTSLQTLDLRSNQISDITPLKSLIIDRGLDIKWKEYGSGISIKDNPLTVPPPEIVKRGREAVVNWFEELEKGKDYLFEAKLLIVGDGRVGKTTLERKLRNVDAIMPGEDETTFGIDIDNYTFTTNEGNDFTVNIWDFGGQEKYYPAHQFFLTKRSLYILVDDASRDDINLDYWLQIIEMLSDKSPVILVQNKKTGRGKGLDEKGLRSRYTNIVKFFAFNFSVVTKEDKSELQQLNLEIEHQLQQLPQIGQELPKQWIDIRKELNRIEKEEAHISQQDYFSLCEKFGLKEKDKSLYLSTYLHDLGVFLHFQEDEVLYKTVILQNEWATHGVYKVLDSKIVNDNSGRFNLDDAKTIWKNGEYQDMHFELLGLMQKFELCYILPGSNNKKFIATQLLPVSQAEYEWDSNNNLQLIFRYDFMPQGLISRLIVRMNRFVKDIDKAWRRGVILKRKNTWAEVIESYGSKKIDIRVKGQYCKELMTLIADDLDDLNESFNLEVPKFVPCICSLCKTLDKPHFYDFEKLEIRKEKGKRTVECEISYEDVSVEQLIDNVFVDIGTIKKVEQVKEEKLARKVFISYSKHDIKALNRLKKTLGLLKQDNKVITWDDTDLIPTEDWDDKIRSKIEQTDIIIFLISIDMLATNYIWDVEIKKVQEKKRIKVLPIIYKDCPWKKIDFFEEKTALPTKGEPILSKKWDYEDQAWTNVEEGMRKLLKSLK